MNPWRGLYAAGLFGFVVVPLLVPFGEILQRATWVWTASDVDRLIHLSLNTLTLTAGTVAIALPVGISLAVLLFRTSFFARRFSIGLLALTLFVPLPVIVSSWQGLLGSDGWLPLSLWRGDARPWATGMEAAIFVHALAAVPWVAFIVGLGLTWVEPEREDEAAQLIGPWRVLLFVTLPRARASILAAALFVVVQTAGEISVTDMMLVSTLAEEVHTQFTLGDRVGLARTLVVSLPGLLLIWTALFAVLSHLEKSLPPLTPPAHRLRPLELGPTSVRLLVAALLLLLLVLPLFSLVWKLGLTGPTRSWSSHAAWHFLQAETRLLGKDLLATLVTALVTGILIACFALVGCWLARDCRWFRWLLLGILTWAWVMPGPVVGIGLHDTILWLPEGPWKALLYHGPSPAPLMWVQILRVLPIAVVFLWPVVRMIPSELFEEARLHGAGALGEFTHIVWPMTRRAALITALASVALCLGEVAASARVETPGWESFTKLVFDRMHYGVDNNLAALCVLMLGSLSAIALVTAGINSGLRLAFASRHENAKQGHG